MHAVRWTLIVWGCLVLLLGALNVCAADDTDGSKAASPSALDKQLLDELDSALLDELEEPGPSTPKTATGEPRSEKTGSPLDDDLLRDLDGDKVDQKLPPPTSRDPLVAIGRQMRDVESRLTEKKLDDQTNQLQQRILDDLAALMQECKKQCQGGGKPGSKPGKSGSGSQAGTNPAGQAPRDAARDSTDKLRERQTELGQQGALVNAMKESWGNLPDHARKHLDNVTTDAFLPKYELMLEKYFKRLSAEDAN